MRTTKHDPTVSVPLTEFDCNQRPPGNGMWNHPQNHISSLLQYAMVCPDNPQLLDCTLTKSKGERRVLVCYDCFNNIISQTGWFNKRDLLSHGSQGWGPRSKCWFVFLEASLLGLQLAIFCVLTWPPKIVEWDWGQGVWVAQYCNRKEQTKGRNLKPFGEMWWFDLWELPKHYREMVMNFWAELSVMTSATYFMDIPCYQS